MVKHKFLTLVLIIFIIYSLRSVYAQISSSDSTITISPALFEKIMDKGSTSSQEIIVYNDKDYPVPISITIGSFEVNEKFSDEVSEKDKLRFDSSKWLNIEPENFILDPKSQKKVSIIIKTPDDAEAGGHYATVYFAPALSLDSVNTDKSIQVPRAGVLAFIVIKGGLDYKLNLLDYTVPKLNIFNSMNFSYNHANTGNIHIAPVTKIEVTDLILQDKYELNPNPYVIMPATERTVNIVWDPGFKFGLFKAKLNLNYKQNIESVTSTKYFVLLPLWLIAGIFTILTLVSLLFIVKYKRLKAAFRILMDRRIYENYRGQRSK